MLIRSQAFSDRLVFAGLPWTTEVVFQSEQPDGVLIAVGGKSQGYSLQIENGKLVLTVTVNNERYRIASQEPVSGWVKATAQFTEDKKIVLLIHDQTVAEKQLSSLVPREPNIAYRIGADSDGQSTLPGFRGTISLVRLTAESKIPVK